MKKAVGVKLSSPVLKHFDMHDDAQGAMRAKKYSWQTRGYLAKNRAIVRKPKGV